MSITTDYLKELKKRSKESRVYRKYQLEGLEIAQILRDESHKSLYIKLAKEGDAESLRRLAKSIAENRNIKRKGAYFMSCVKLAPKTNARRQDRHHRK